MGYTIGIYLAAGSSSRMGRNKLALPLFTTTLGSVALKAALNSNLDEVLIVKRGDDRLEWVDSSCEGHFRSIPCHDAHLGQAQSIVAGIQAAVTCGADAIVIMLADQPFLRTHHLNAMIEAAGRECVQYIGTNVDGRTQPPLLFSKQVFPALMKLKGDIGARHLLPTLTGRSLNIQERREAYDIDTEEEYAWLIRQQNIP
ncbi:hypothetical protein DH09_02430 [Bacillaceae bacterium JMAK1]|nr:hypothetical protein DH09_02430 [Bacillaceae bacterium JMAK1]